MSTRVFFLNSNVAQYGEEELNSIQKFLFGQGILNTVGSSWEDWIANGDLKVTQRGAGANMSVDVSAGWSLLNTTRNSITFKVFCQSIGVTNLAVSSNATGSNRVDAVIMRVSRSATPNTTTNNVVTLQLLTGTSSVALTDGAITTAIGSDDFIRLANITVPNGAVTVVNANISDTRVRSATSSIFKQAPEMLEFKVLATDPSTVNLAEGFAWFNSTSHTLNFWNGSAVKQLGGSSSFLSADDAVIDGTDQVQTTANGTQTFGAVNSTTNANKIDQSFITARGSISGVKLFKQADSGTFTGTVTVELYADSAGSPTGSALATVTLSNAQWLARAVGEFTATFGTPYASTSGATYHILISASTADNTNHPNLGTNTAGGYASGSVQRWNTTDGYVAIATIDLYFKTLHTVTGKVAKTDATGKIDYSVIPVKFGGTGADGALTISSGATNIDCANAPIVVKNYTSVSITGTASLTFTNPHANGTIVIIKSQGDVVLTSSTAPMIAMQGMGASQGAGAGASGGAGVGGAGATGNATCYVPSTCGGGGGASNATNVGSTAGASAFFGNISLLGKYAQPFQVGSGGGGGGDGGSGGNAGGRGGGGIIIECNGTWFFTTTNGISVAGANGTNAITSGGSGGGGGGGFCYVLYTTLASNSGTITVSGGAGGTTGGSSCNSGAGGASQFTNGVGGGGKNSAGGVGGAGWSSVAQNTEFF